MLCTEKPAMSTAKTNSVFPIKFSLFINNFLSIVLLFVFTNYLQEGVALGDLKKRFLSNSLISNYYIK
jgi:hypothetical protein